MMEIALWKEFLDWKMCMIGQSTHLTASLVSLSIYIDVSIPIDLGSSMWSPCMVEGYDLFS